MLFKTEYMSSLSAQSEGQHQTPQELLTTNFKEVICDLLNYINRVGIDVNIDYATYRLDWLISLCTRFGSHLEKEETFVEHLLHAQELLSGIIRNDNQTTSSFVLDNERNAVMPQKVEAQGLISQRNKSSFLWNMGLKLPTLQKCCV